MAQRFPNGRLVVFSKAPVPGEVKTRLVPPLDTQTAAELHRRLVEQTLTTTCAAGLCPVELWCAPDTSHAFFRACRQRYGIPLDTQRGADLGERMAETFRRLLAECEYVVLLGSDCPTLGQGELYAALHALDSGYNAVIAPAADGGYVLLGLRDPAEALFRDIPWGSAEVTEITRRRMSDRRWRWLELAIQHDIDRPEDLRHLPPHLQPNHSVPPRRRGEAGPISFG